MTDAAPLATYRFDRFELDLGDRQLRDGHATVEVKNRYFDALALLVREQGKLVTKDRFLDEVWRGVPVTDEALTQCVRTLRRQLGDDAANPRFIETVPKHGYRFIAAVEPATGDAKQPAAPQRKRAPDLLLLGVAGTVGGGVAGAVGGLFYGFVAAAQPAEPGVGALSILLVLLALTTLVAIIGAAGVAFGISAAIAASGRVGPWSIAGGTLGGLLVGAFVKLLGLDALTLLFGRSPGDITGALEGAILGGAVGLAAWLGGLGTRKWSLRVNSAAAALGGGLAGAAIAMAGGHLMGGSLALLAEHFPGSRLRLDRIGTAIGEQGFGGNAQLLTSALEGALFGACVIGAMVVARRRVEGRAS